MEQSVTIQFEQSVTSVQLLEQLPGGDFMQIKAAGATGSLELQKQQLEGLCLNLQEVVNRLNDSYKKIFSEHKEQIAKLSVEIARKILSQQQEEGEYKIELIIQEALKEASSLENVTIYLNPEDLLSWQKAQQEGSGTIPEEVKLVADGDIGLAECRIETPKGVIESIIEKHLERIEDALKKT
ncbi:MAG: FliH/SctL family protein [Planctomycetota bacterium]|jgi:flagellar biosynthesis/type III secretory pathway protein FliH